MAPLAPIVGSFELELVTICSNAAANPQMK
jgi:hypothetical protein